MNYEEKLRLAKEALASGSYDKETIEYIFPELRESEDERIIKTLKEIVNWGCAKNISVENNVELKDCLAWLEKQGEQKQIIAVDSDQLLKILPRTVEWSEEDEKHIENIIACLEEFLSPRFPIYRGGIVDEINWLKSLKPSNWKPSEEQIESLKIVLNYLKRDYGRSYEEAVLESLYNTLKTL